ncbi:MAG: PIN domain-containing protein [Nitrospinota bacterium]
MRGHIFLDTSFIIALEDADDQNRKMAITFWNSFKKKPAKLTTTTYVFDETVTFLRKRISYAKAAYVGKLILSSPMVEMVHISKEDFEKGWEMFLKYQDKYFSFTDCLSFLVMEQRNIKKALTFDEHFSQKGFCMIPLFSL